MTASRWKLPWVMLIVLSETLLPPRLSIAWPLRYFLLSQDQAAHTLSRSPGTSSSRADAHVHGV